MAPRKEGPEAVGKAPSLVSRLYPRDEILPLEDLLIKLASLSTLATPLAKTLYQSGDHADYRHGLLRRVWCIQYRRAPELTEGFSLEQASTQIQLLRLAVSHLLVSPKTRNNVLCTGAQRQDLASGRPFQPGAAAMLLNSPCWQLLLSRIGDTLMLYLLLHCSLFLQLDNGGLVQLTGYCMAKIARAAVFGGVGASRCVLDYKLPTNKSELKQPVSVIVQASCQTEAPDLMDACAYQEGEEEQRLDEHEDKNELVAPKTTTMASSLDIVLPTITAHLLRPARPSSWKRRKLTLQRSLELPPTQELDDCSSLTMGDAPGKELVPQSTLQHRQEKKTPGLGLSRMILPRQLIFYSATFSSRAGLAKHHILRQLQGRKQQGRSLYAAIFKSKSSWGLMESVKTMRACHPPPPPCKRIPREHRQLVKLLSKLTSRAATCPSGRLLNRICPLPSVLDTQAPAMDGQSLRVSCSERLEKAMNEVHALLQEPAGSGHGDLASFEANADGDGNNNNLETALIDRSINRLVRTPHQDGSSRPPANSNGVGPLSNARSSASRMWPGPPPLLPALHFASSELRSEYVHGCYQRDDHAIPQQQQREEDTNRQASSANESHWPAITPQSHTPFPLRTPGGVSTVPPTPATGQGIQSTTARLRTEKTPHLQLPQEECVNLSIAPPTQQLQSSNVPSPLYHPSLPFVKTPAALHGIAQLRSETGDKPSSLAGRWVTHARVTAFLWACLVHIVPRALLGTTKKARRVLRMTLQRFVSLRRFESFTVHDLLKGLPISAFGCLGATRPRSAAHSMQRRLGAWLGWLFASFVIPLLRAHFYVTEGDGVRQHVFYFRKPVWVALRRTALDDLQNTQYRAVPKKHAYEALRKRTLGVAKLRLLPKRAGVRVITNLGRATQVTLPAPAVAVDNATRHLLSKKITTRYRSVNETMQDVFQVLKYEAFQRPEVLGCSVQGLNDIYCQLVPQLRRWRAVDFVDFQMNRLRNDSDDHRHNDNPSSRPTQLYIATMDVTRAFDSMDAGVAFELAAPLFQSDAYVIQEYTEVSPAMSGRLQIRTRRRASAADPAAPSPREPAWAWAEVAGPGRGVRPGAVSRTLRRDALLALLREHLTANFVRLRRRWHVQTRGVPQGSTLSTLLCCLYLAKVEREALTEAWAARGRVSQLAGLAAGNSILLPDTGIPSSCDVLSTTIAPGPVDITNEVSVDAPQEQALIPNQKSTLHSSSASSTLHQRTSPPLLIVLRQVDDFIIISDSRKAAEAFLERMQAGFPELGIAVNPLKTKTSWNAAEEEEHRVDFKQNASLVSSRCGAVLVPWCGLLFDTRTLAVYADYTRYQGDQVRWSFGLPARRGSSAAAVLPAKIAGFLRLKAHPLLLDASLCGNDVVAVNILQAWCLAGMKLHVYARGLPSGRASSGLVQASFESGLAFLAQASRARRVRPVYPTSPSRVSGAGLSLNQIKYLGLVAWHRTLGQKQSVYAGFLCWAEEELRTASMRAVAGGLESATRPERSSVLDAIRF